MFDCLKVYIGMGWPLFPCRERDGFNAFGKPKEGKSPLTHHGFLDATLDLGQIEAWHKQYPNCAWGVATSAEHGVIDIDPKHGGDKTLAALIAEHFCGSRLQRAQLEGAALPVLKHGFTHFDLEITPIRAQCEGLAGVMEGPDTLWYNARQPPRIGLPAPIATLLSAASAPPS